MHRANILHYLSPFLNSNDCNFQVSEELAQKLGREDAERLLKDKKLVLLVDLDQTLVHTTNDNVPPNLKVNNGFLLVTLN